MARPEAKIQKAVIEQLKINDWFVKNTHGNIYSSGLPDLYCAHKKYGQRWIEVKNPEAYSFTSAQRETFLLMAAAGVGIWIATDPKEIPDLLFKPPNLIFYLGIMK